MYIFKQTQVKNEEKYCIFIRFHAETASKMYTKLVSLHVFTSATSASAQYKHRGHRNKELPTATIDLWGSDPLMCFSVLVLIKPSFASVQIYKAFFQRCW